VSRRQARNPSKGSVCVGVAKWQVEVVWLARCVGRVRAQVCVSCKVVGGRGPAGVVGVLRCSGVRGCVVPQVVWQAAQCRSPAGRQACVARGGASGA